MKHILFCAVVLTFIGTVCFANSAPVVSNVVVSQRTDGSKFVDIHYDLADSGGYACTVSVQVSSDGGSLFAVPAEAFTGSIGANISPGTGKLITWDCAKDLPGVFGSNYQVKIVADDGHTSIPNDMVSIPGGTFLMGDSKGDGWSSELPVHTVTLSTFSMGRYDITNGQYCQYLNSALSQGFITVTIYGVVYPISDDPWSPYPGPYFWRSTYVSENPIAFSGGVFSVRAKGGRSMVNDPVVDKLVWSGSLLQLAEPAGRQRAVLRSFNVLGM